MNERHRSVPCIEHGAPGVQRYDRHRRSDQTPRSASQRVINAEQSVERAEPVFNAPRRASRRRGRPNMLCSHLTAYIVKSEVCGMSSVAIRELRARASEIVRRAEAGEAFLVTKRGRPVAIMLPFDVDAEDLILAEAEPFVRLRARARTNCIRARPPVGARCDPRRSGWLSRQGPSGHARRVSATSRR